MTSPSDTKISETDIARCASRARLELSGASRQRIAEELSEVKTLLSVLQTAPRGQFAPLQQLHEDFTPAREDSVLPSLCRQTALRNAPETDGTYVRVPPVL